MSEPTNSGKQGRDRIAYFVVGEIVLHSEYKYDPKLRPDPEPPELTDWVSILWDRFGLRDFPYKIVSSLSFNDGETGTSLVRLRIKSLIQTDTDEDSDLGTKDDGLIDLLKRLNDLRKDSEDIRGITLRSAAPNWCLTGSPHSPTDPGPGAYPQPVDDGKVITSNRHKFDTNKLDSLTTPPGKASAKNVNVVIFDTVPPECTLALAYLLFDKNDLLQEVKNRVTIKRAGDLGITLLPDLTRDGSGELHGYTNKALYDMSDHGLFIAGIIIDQLVVANPKNPPANVNIYLVETQNNYGVGTITSLAQGIKALIKGEIIPEAEMDYPLIVNCSLCVSFLGVLRDEMESLCAPLLRLENKFKAKGGIRIIAAAGNDSISTNAPAPTRYPAAFDFVLGVGAVEKGGNRAFYSNFADVQPQDGLMVFGGKANRPVDENLTDDTGEGMLGLYIGNFPTIKADGTLDETTDGTPSTNGWAWWAGTSFAAAVMSGIFARAAAKGIDIRRNPVSTSSSPVSDFRDDLKGKKKGTTPHQEPFIDDDQN